MFYTIRVVFSSFKPHFMYILYSSDEIAVIQWITCSKNRVNARVIPFWSVHVTSLTTSVSSMRFLVEIMIIVNAILKSHMINRILHSRSFPMTFMKLAEGSFHKFHMK